MHSSQRLLRTLSGGSFLGCPSLSPLACDCHVIGEDSGILLENKSTMQSMFCCVYCCKEDDLSSRAWSLPFNKREPLLFLLHSAARKKVFLCNICGSLQ